MNADYRWRLDPGVKRYVVTYKMLNPASKLSRFWQGFAVNAILWLVLNRLWSGIVDGQWTGRLFQDVGGAVFFGLLMALTGSSPGFDYYVLVGDDRVETSGSLGFRKMNRDVQREDVRKIYERTLRPEGLLGRRIRGLAVEDGRWFVFIPDRIPEYSEIKTKLLKWLPAKQDQDSHSSV